MTKNLNFLCGQKVMMAFIGALLKINFQISLLKAVNVFSPLTKTKKFYSEQFDKENLILDNFNHKETFNLIKKENWSSTTLLVI